MVPSGTVKALIYLLDTSNLYSDEAEPLSFCNEIGAFTLARGILRVVPNESFRTISDARGHVANFIRSWEFESELLLGRGIYRFIFLSAETTGEVIDADQHPPMERKYSPKKKEKFITEFGCYPPAPKIRVIPEMEALLERFRGARIGIGEPITSCGYFALTLIESTAGSRRAASEKYNVDFKMLNKLGELTSTRGDLRVARKYAPGAASLSVREKVWIESAIGCIIYQMGLEAAGNLSNYITMDEMPHLE